MAENGHLAELKRDIQYGPPLILFLGAGISSTYIPTWKPLLGELIDRAVDQGLGNSNRDERDVIKNILANEDGKYQWSPYQQAGILKRLLGDYYIRELRECLYKRTRAEEDGAILGSVVSLCQHRFVTAVVTYNFDDLLESEVFCKGRSVNTIYGRAQRERRKICPRSTAPILPVYHVHGLIPHQDSLPSEEDALVVFSQEEYFQTMLEPFAWQTTTQLHFLRNYTCLFLGTSVTDFDMLRILSHARSYIRPGTGRTYALTCRESIVGRKKRSKYKRHDDLVMRIWSTLMNMVGVKMVLAGDGYISIKTSVDELSELV